MARFPTHTVLLAKDASRLNPYTPPVTSSDDRDRCPVCGALVGYFRFVLPFGHCDQCGNYLTVRHWERARGLSLIIPLIAGFGPLASRSLGFQAAQFPTMELLLGYLVVLRIYDKFAGRLVPAICWGWLALRDDDRLPKAMDD